MGAAQPRNNSLRAAGEIGTGASKQTWSGYFLSKHDNIARTDDSANVPVRDCLGTCPRARHAWLEMFWFLRVVADTLHTASIPS